MSDSGSPQISVIVPVFNAARFVRASVSSVLDHTIADVEVICVDDGSSDDSVEVLELLAASDARVTLVRLDSNQGAGTARNTGIGRATGAYLFFLDADDMVPPGSLDLLLSAATLTQSALAIGKLLWYRTEAESVLHVPKATGGTIVTTDIHESSYLQSVPGCHCCNLYSRQLLEVHGISYATDLSYGEDQLFQATAMIKAGKVALVDEVVYVYHHYRSQSLTRKPPSLRNLLDDVEFQRRTARLFSSHGLPDAARRFLTSWSYSIREYWLKIPTALTRDEAMHFFSCFRALVAESGVTPWSESTPERHRHLLSLIIGGDDEQALALLADEAACTGPSAAAQPQADT